MRFRSSPSDIHRHHQYNQLKFAIFPRPRKSGLCSERPWRWPMARRRGMLANKVALVTGSVDGIGFAIAEALASQGCSVMLNGLASEEQGAQSVARLEAKGGKAAFHGADLSDPRQIADLVAESERRYGPIDIVI